MSMPTFAKLLLSSSIALALSACGGGGSSNDDTPPAPTPSGDVLALTASNKLISFNRDTPGTVVSSTAITGLGAGESLLGIDYRPADGLLYGVGSTGRLYTINPASGALTLKSTLTADTADTTAPFTGLFGTEFGIDFNPAADRLRIVSNTGLNLRVNVDTGAVTTDGIINGGANNAAVTASAYTNSFAGTATTTLYGIDSTNDLLYTQNPPNNGTLSLPVTLGVDATAINGLDIDARSNAGYAVFTVGGARNLYRINLAAAGNAATLVGSVAIGEDIRGIALKSLDAPLVYGLSDDARLVSFRPATPNTLLSSMAIGGLAAGETLLGIDFRPRDNLLYGITSAARIVTIDTASAVATAKAALAADVTDITLPYSGLAGTQFAVDFNPVADRLRVISNTGLNLRINVDSGATTTDGAINRSGATALVTAGAYTNSFPGALTTMLYDIDGNASALALQNPPNDGTLVDVGALGVTVAGDLGVDIAGGANGLALAALRQTGSGPSSLYRIDLATGAASLINGATTVSTSVIGTGNAGMRDIAIALK